MPRCTRPQRSIPRDPTSHPRLSRGSVVYWTALLALLVLAPLVWAAAPGGHVQITAVHVDETTNIITIMGQQMNFGPGP